MRRSALLFLFLLITGLVYGQHDTVYSIREVPIEGLRLQRIKSTSRIEYADTSVAVRLTSASLTDLLEAGSSVFIKNNGGGRLATLSIRGTSASQNNITWNGLSLNTPTLGLYDLSLMPVFFTDEIAVQFGGNGPLNGSDAIGGVVHLTSLPEINNGVHLQLYSSAASFHDFQEGLKVNYSNSNLSFRTAFYRHDAKNNYPFKDIYIAGSPDIIQQHAALNQSGLLQELCYLKNKEQFDIHLMVLNARHEIPSLMGSLTRISKQVEHDEQIRLVTQWKHQGRMFHTLAGAGVVSDKIHFVDPNIYLDDLSRGSSAQFFTEVSYSPGAVAFAGGITSSHSQAFVNSRVFTSSSGYPQKHQLVETALYMNQSYSYSNRVTIQASQRYKITAIGKNKFVTALSAKYNFLSALSLVANASEVYRTPTLNDLYWRPGGNSSLQPEHGYQGDLSLTCSLQRKAVKASVSAGMFYININDWIQWVPGADNYYAPVNQDRIHSRGLEGSMAVAVVSGSWKFSFNSSGQYIAANNQSGNSASLPEDLINGINTISTGTTEEQQLVYIPRLAWKAGGMINRKNTSLRLSYDYTGHRYITEDNTNWLEPYYTSALSISQEMPLKKQHITLCLTANNIFNEQYEVVALRPMPGRNFRLSILVDIK